MQGHDSNNSGQSLTVSSYTYNSGTGLVTLTMAATVPEVLVTGVPMTITQLAGVGTTYSVAPIPTISTSGLVTLTTSGSVAFSANASINVSGLNIAGLNGTFLTAASASGTTVTYNGPASQAGSPSGGGTLFWNAVDGTFICVSASGTTVTYTAPTGQSNAPTGGGTVGLGTQYGLRVRANKASNGVFSAFHAAGDLFDTAALAVGTSTSRANLLFLACTFSKGASVTGVDVSPPTNAFTAQFQNCSLGSFLPVWTFSQLPTGGNVFEGDEFSISDSTTNTIELPNAAGSGTDHVWVRYNGSNFTVVAK